MPSYLVYQVLKNYSNAENCLTREQIRNYLKKDYNIKIKSNDTITSDLNEIGYINWGELKERSGELNSSVVKKGNQGFFLLEDNDLNLGETTLLLNSIMSNSSLHEKDYNILKNKIIKISNSTNTFFELKRIEKISASLRKNSLHKVLENNLTTIVKALVNKKDIEFDHKLSMPSSIEGITKIENQLTIIHITMRPCYILCKDGEIIIIGSKFNLNFDNRKLESVDNKKYVLYSVYLENMEKINMLEDESGTPLKSYDEFDENTLLSSLYNLRSPIYEGIFDIKNYFGIKKYLFKFENADDFTDLYNYFGLNIKKIDETKNTFLDGRKEHYFTATIEAFADDVTTFIISANKSKRYKISMDKFAKSPYFPRDDIDGFGFITTREQQDNRELAAQLNDALDNIVTAFKNIKDSLKNNTLF